MNSQERELFWQTLCSLTGNSVEDVQKLKQSIKVPRFLFRYRPVSTNTLEALRTNRLYFSSANYYDDPFDTFLHIDIDRIKNEYLSAFQTPESTAAVIEQVIPIVSHVLPKEQLAQITVENVTNALSQGLLERFLNSTLTLRDEVKNRNLWDISRVRAA